MLVKEKYIYNLYMVLYGLIFGLLVIPWIYFNEKTVAYSFLPRKILFILIAIVVLLIIFERNAIHQKIFKFSVFVGFGCLHLLANGYLEPHYLLEFVYLETALLVFYAPTAVKERMLKYSSLVLYAVLIKAFIFHMGSYFHGGFLSSNLYATYIVFLCYVEVYRKRYWNLIPSIVVVYLAGSKAAYMAMFALIFFAFINYLQTTGRLKKFFSLMSQIKFIRMKTFYSPMLISAFLILAFTQVMVRTDYYINWRKQMEPSKADTTQNNMVMYGLGESEKIEEQRVILLKTKEMQFHENKISLKPLVTDVGMSVGLRVSQYDYIYSNWEKYFWIGDANEAQKESFGHNPHSAFPDFVSRLGLVCLILVLLFYSRLFRLMDLFFINVSIIPILAFQPYGFTIGHSMVIFSLVYSLSKLAHQQASAKIKTNS